MKQFSNLTPVSQDIAEPLARQAMVRIARLFVGNGVKKDHIKLVSFEGFHATLTGELSLTPMAKIREEKVPGRRPTQQDVPTGGLHRAVEAYTGTLGQDERFQHAVRSKLRSMPSQGFGLKGAPIPVEGAATSFSEVEDCRPCRGDGETACAPCQSRGRIICEKCRGLRESPCYVCKGQGVTQGPNGQETPCYACNGRRVLVCDHCRGVGQLDCRYCMGKGRVVCPSCQGHKAMTRLVHVDVDVIPDFTLEQDHVPPELYEAVMAFGPHFLAERGHLEIEALAKAQKKESYYGTTASKKGWTEAYQVTCPWISLSVQIGPHKVSCFALGQKSLLVSMPDMLDELLDPTIQKLHNAAHGRASPVMVLERAGRKRIIREALPVLMRKGRKVALQAVMANYPAGLSRKTAKNLIGNLSQTLKRIVRLPAWITASGGFLLAMLAYAYWFLLDGHTIGVTLLPEAPALVLDGLWIGFVSCLYFWGVRIIERFVFRQIFKRIKLADILPKRMTRSGGIELSFTIAVIMIGLALLITQTNGVWGL